jgi:hypothetical protein
MMFLLPPQVKFGVFFDNELNYPISQLNTESLKYINLEKYDILIMPDGDYDAFDDKTVASKLDNFIRNGGKLIATKAERKSWLNLAGAVSI